MPSANGAVLFRQIRRLATAQFAEQRTDAQLLQQFLAEREEAAFAALVQRHGPMVLGLCRSVLQHQQDAEDVFQAAFLVLARKAHTIRKQQSLSSWLHGVAYRLALKARRRSSRHRHFEPPPETPAPASTLDDLTVREVRAILHQELHRLPEKYRAPLLLCYWEGKTRDEAAVQLGMTSGALKKCLERARNLLGSRLIGRGLVPSAALFTTVLWSSSARAAVSKTLIQTTAQAATAFSVGKTVSATGAAAALAEGVLRTMTLTKWATTILTILLLGTLGTGLGLATYPFRSAQPPTINNPVNINAEQGRPEPKEVVGKKVSDEERILGTWKIVAGRRNGEDEPNEGVKAFMRLTFEKDGKVTISVLETNQVRRYKITAPGVIDLTMKSDDTDITPGIYQFDAKDRLSICIGEGPNAKRPTKFTAEKGDNQNLLVLERAKQPTPEEIAKFKQPVAKMGEAARRAFSVNNLKQIALAFHGYHDVHNGFPTHAIYSKDGQTPLLSWRVAILPFIDQAALYNEFKLDEPWDSANNKKLISRIPTVYASVNADDKDAKQKGLTYYQVFTGPDTIFDGPKKMKFQGITDGTSNTLLALEAKDPVIWTKPDDLTLPKAKDQLPPIGGLFPAGTNAALCDGSVRFLPRTIRPELLRAIVTPTGNERVNFDE